MPSPALGSLAIQTPTPTQTVTVSPSTCYNISLFKDLMKEYRKLDDSIPMRYNRTMAQFRDLDRTAGSGKSSVQDQTCLHLWREIVDNWTRREKILNYCVGVIDASKQEKQTTLESTSDDPRTQRKMQAALFGDETKRNQIHNELSVETIVRQRSVNAFRSRCKYFDAPGPDNEATRLWKAAEQMATQ